MCTLHPSKDCVAKGLEADSKGHWRQINRKSSIPPHKAILTTQVGTSGEGKEKHTRPPWQHEGNPTRAAPLCLRIQIALILERRYLLGAGYGSDTG